MNEVNKTLYIPLYGKALVSQIGIINKDEMAQKIWSTSGLKMHGKAKSKWLAYNMAMRSRVFDDYVKDNIDDDTLVLHLGCGLDSRCFRINKKAKWLDVDFEDVINERKKFYQENAEYKMLSFDITETNKLLELPNAKKALVVMEGVSMYFDNNKLLNILNTLSTKYAQVQIILDTYTSFAAKISKYKNPANELGVNNFYGIDDIAELIKDSDYKLIKELSFTPRYLVDELNGFEHFFFKLMFVNKLYGKFYKLQVLKKVKSKDN